MISHIAVDLKKKRKRCDVWPWPFVELGFGHDSLLHQLEQELAHVVPCDLTALQSRLHSNAHKDVQLRAQIELVHTLDSLLQRPNKY